MYLFVILLASFSLSDNFDLFLLFILYTRKIFIDGKIDKEDNSKDSYHGRSGQTQIGTWWSGQNGLMTNLEIDTLYIIDKAVEYTDQQLCFAKAFNSQMP